MDRSGEFSKRIWSCRPFRSSRAGRTTALLELSRTARRRMRTIECHGLSQPAGWRDRDGSLWFPTAKGFVQVARPDRAVCRRLEP